MRAMTYKLFEPLKNHQLIPAFIVLLVCILPIFHMLLFFWPLIVSTTLGVLAVVSFRHQAEKQHIPEIAERGVVESNRHPDLIPGPAFEEKISNVLMVGNQEVTWLEWLHYEDTQKLCVQEGHDPAAWDTCGYDISATISKEWGNASASTSANDKLSTMSSDGSTICRDEASNQVIAWSKDNNRPDKPSDQDVAPAFALVLTDKNATRTVVTASTAISNNDLSQDKLKVNAPVVSTSTDDMDGDSTGDDCTCGFGSRREDDTARHALKREGVALTVNEQCDAGVPACPKEQDALVLPFTDKSTSSLLDMECAEIDAGDEEEKDLQRSATRGPL